MPLLPLQGLGATLLRNTPNYGMYFGVYEYLKYRFTPKGGVPSDLAVWQLFVASGAAGLSFWAFTYPTDVIKSSMQSDAIRRADRRFANMADCARRLWTEEGGWRRFYRGYTPCLMRAVPANITMLVVVEKCRIYLDPYL